MTIELLAQYNRSNFVRKIGKYTLTRVYKIDDCGPEDSIGLKGSAGVGPDEGPATDTIPFSVDIEHESTLCGSDGGEETSETIICYATDREAVNPDAAAGMNETRLTVTYIGYRIRPLYWDARILSASEQIVLGLADNAGPGVSTPATRQIGGEAEGTDAFRPRIEFLIYENVRGAALMGGKLALIVELNSTVNEQGWDPEVTEIAAAYPQGYWLYIGAEVTHLPRYTFSIVHHFISVPPYVEAGGNPDMHLHKWHEIRKIPVEIVDGSEKSRKQFSTNATYSKTHLIAGTDTLHRFADLDL